MSSRFHSPTTSKIAGKRTKKSALKHSLGKRLSTKTHHKTPLRFPSKAPIFSKEAHLYEDTPPFAQMNKNVPLSLLLKALTKQQLIDLIVYRLVGAQPNSEVKLRQELPMPDVQSLIEDLQQAKRNIFRCLPASKFNHRDNAAYAKAEHALSQFKTTLLDHLQVLHDSENWDAQVDYVTKAWEIVHSIPIWDSILHNGTRGQCFKALSTNCTEAVKSGGLRLGTKRLLHVERNIPEWSKECDEIRKCSVAINRAVRQTSRYLQ